MASTNPVLDRGPHGLAAGADAVRDLPAGAAVRGILQVRPARGHVPGGQTVRAVSGIAGIGADPLAAHDRRIAPRNRPVGPRRHPLDHRAARTAAGIVRIGEAGTRRVLHARGGQAPLRHVGPGIARHRAGLRGVSCNSARRRRPGLPDRTGRRLRILGVCRHARQHPEHQAAQREHGDPGEQPDDPGGAVDQDIRAAEYVFGSFVFDHRAPPRRCRCHRATSRPALPSAATASRAATRPMFPVTRS